MKDNARSTDQKSLYGLLLVNAWNISTMVTILASNGMSSIDVDIQFHPIFMMMEDDVFSHFHAADHIIVYFP
jgi:hypothetical protein